MADPNTRPDSEEHELLGRLYSDISGEKYPISRDLAGMIVLLRTEFEPRLAAAIWLADHAEVLVRRVCVEWRYCEKRADAKLADKTALVTTLTDLLAVSVGGVPTATIGSLLIKLGSDQICSCDKHPTGDHRYFMGRVVATSVGGVTNASQSADPFLRLVSRWTDEARGVSLGVSHVQYYRAWARLARLYGDKGEHDRAISKLTQAFEIGGADAAGDAWLHNEYAWHLTLADRSADAIGPATRACELEPNAASYWDTLGWAQHRAGVSQVAVASLRKAIEIDVTDRHPWYGIDGKVEIRYHLAACYASLGHRQELADVVRDMESLSPRSDWVLRARELVCDAL
jgi:tetratricopeptide (TPR) repeat protein